MSEIILDIDPATTLVINGIYVAKRFELAFKQWNDLEKTSPKAYEGTFEMVFCYDPLFTQVKERLTESSGLSKAGNTITVSRNDEENIFQPIVYYWQMICTLSPNNSYVVHKGWTKVNPSPKPTT